MSDVQRSGLWMLAVALVCGCQASVPSDVPGSDAGRNDAGPMEASAPAGTTLVMVADATWLDPGMTWLGVRVVVINGEGAPPASLNPGAFDLEIDSGALLGASSESTCPLDVSVAPGARLSCVAVYELIPGDVPVRIHYDAGERWVTAEVGACGPATPNGLCPYGQGCADGACALECSAEAPDGYCPADQRCVIPYGEPPWWSGRECAPPCAPETPTGYCDDGVCVDGRCDTSCLSFTQNETCEACRSAVFYEGRCMAETEAVLDCPSGDDCIGCALNQEISSCECTSSRRCAGCEEVSVAFWECYARECPSCVL